MPVSIFEPHTEEQKLRILADYDRDLNSLKDDIEAILNWAKKQPHLPEIPSEQMIGSFLVINKFRMETTKKKLDMYYSIRKKVPEVFANINPTVSPMKDFANVLYYVPLPKLTPDLVRVTVFKMADPNPEVFDPYLFFGWSLDVTEIRLNEDYCTSDLLINDLENLGSGHVFKISPMALKKASSIVENVFATRTKGLHFINCPPIIDTFLKMFKAVVSPKVAERVYVHESYDSLFEQVPKEILPADYGGQEKSLKELNDNLKEYMFNYKERFDKLDQMEVNESLRLEPLDDDILGIQGNFKKLCVD